MTPEERQDWPRWFRKVRRLSRSRRTRMQTSWACAQYILNNTNAISDPETERAYHARILGAMERTAELVDYLDTEMRADPSYVPTDALWGDLCERMLAEQRILREHKLQPLVAPA